jgi:L-threonylcarbamoyladenylate synthase
LGGDALNRESSRKIYEAKGRPSDNPLIVHIANMEALESIVMEVTPQARQIAEAFWPGPLTMILKKSKKVPYETTGGLDTVAVRMPSHPVAQKLIEYAGGYVAAPSANVSGRPSPTLAKYVFEDMEGKIPMIIDSGIVGIGVESTIVDLTEGTPVILRPGSITQEMLQEVLGDVKSDVGMLTKPEGTAPKAPGMKYRHYAPKGNLTIVSGDSADVVAYINEASAAAAKEGKRTGVLCTQETMHLYQADSIKCLGTRNDESTVAQGLYQILRECDDEGLEVMFAESFSTQGIGQAIMNRLLKAAGYQMVEL